MVSAPFVCPFVRHFLSLTSIFLLQIAIKGKGFCSSAQTAAKLLFGNVLRVAAVNVIGDFVLFLGKMAVSLACAVLAFLMLDGERYKTGQDKISSPLAPVLVRRFFTCFLNRETSGCCGFMLKKPKANANFVSIDPSITYRTWLAAPSNLASRL